MLSFCFHYLVQKYIYMYDVCIFWFSFCKNIPTGKMIEAYPPKKTTTKELALHSKAPVFNRYSDFQSNVAGETIL